MLVEVHRQFETARHQVAGLRTLRTQLGRLLVDADHLPRQTLQPGLCVERLVVKFDPVPQLSNPTAPRLRAQESQACRGDTRSTEEHAHKHTSAETHAGNYLCPTLACDQIENTFPIASCGVPRSIVCNASMQMSSPENPGKENRGSTLIPCSVWRASSSDVRHRDVRASGVRRHLRGDPSPATSRP